MTGGRGRWEAKQNLKQERTAPFPSAVVKGRLVHQGVGVSGDSGVVVEQLRAGLGADGNGQYELLAWRKMIVFAHY